MASSVFVIAPTAFPATVSTIWPPSTVPAVASADDSSGVELGVRFRSDVDGSITGIRFYKGAGNTGTHIGNLWTTSGTRLATATFSSETASGWQQVNLAAPVAIAANTDYIASYYAPAGHYAENVGYFASSGVDNPPLHAPLSTAAAPNGIYRYGASSGFPASTFQATNYWVDVVFATSTGPDTTPPAVSGTSPAANAAGVPVTTTPTATFSEPVQAATVSFVLRDPGSATVPATVTYDSATNTAKLTPNSPLAASTVYSATVSGARDLAGNAMTAPFTWSFTTASPPPPPSGPGGPILIITKGTNPFTTYVAEILRNEGMNEWATAEISGVTATTLAGYDVAILGDMALTATQASMLSTWVTGGGNLVAMHPDKQLAGLLGLADTGTSLSDGYLAVNTASGPGLGITNQSIQFHGPADRYTLSGATSVATLYSNATTATANPAVTLRSVGANGGEAAAFTYDLARSVVLTRQGNPAWAGQERDGSSPIRSDDLFYGAASFDRRPDWVDLAKVAIPQADEQQRLLVNLIQAMNSDRKPLPRFWYLPKGKKAAVFISGDDHGNGGTAGRFDQLASKSTPGCSVADWECLRMSSYIYAGTPITDNQAASYTAAGFEIGTHVNTGCANWTPASLENAMATQLAQVAAQLPSIPPGPSERVHCIAWSDWATLPKTELAHGIRLDATYYYWPSGWVNNRPGFFTGSGLPMRFADLDGTPIDVYQATTQMTDESGQAYPFTVDTLLDNALGPLGYYGVFSANMHTDSATSAGSDAIIASAQARGVPVISGRQLLSWLDGRNSSSFGSLAWNADKLSFTVSVGTGATGLQAMVPSGSRSGPLTGLTRNGSPVTFSTQTIKGVQYAFFAATPGAYVASYTPDTTAPVITAVTAVAGSTTATITWTTNEPSDSHVDYGTSALALTASADNPAPVTSHQLVLTGLAPNTTYFYRVRSADASGNAATSPSTTGPPASFATEASLTDTTVADFSAGTLGTGAYISQTSDGEVTLAPTVGAEFVGTTLPSGWSSTAWTGGGSATVGSGALSVDGARAHPTATWSAGRSLEFVCTFTGQGFQHAGLGVDLNSAPWAIFSTKAGGVLVARTNNGAGETETALNPGLLGAPHRFRIDWTSTSVTYSVDGAIVATHPRAVTAAMRPIVSDFSPGGGAVAVDWMRLTPYAASGTITSRVLDAGSLKTWQSASWSADQPSGTSVTLRVRTGNTPTPDATWSAYASLSGSGAPIGQAARYLQYEATLTTTSSGQTPALQQVSVRYSS